MKAGLLFALAGASLATHAYAASPPASDTEWLRLLHYKRHFPYLSAKSEVDGSDFFFAESGASDPEAELHATIKALQENKAKIGPLKQTPRCAFKARLHFLNRVLGLGIKDDVCPEFDDYLQRIQPASVTLVFASALPNEPGSLFGHTFLRINSGKQYSKEPQGARAELLDYGISFAAMVGEEGFAEYAIRGVFGGYVGQFSVVPYYLKIQEYTTMESRDVWEYDLSLTQPEVVVLLEHLWELWTTSYFNYYFFDENCAYQLLTLLEAARPDWSVSDFGVHAIPGETVKRIVDTPGAVTHVTFRPSLRKKLLHRFDVLNADQRQNVMKLAERNKKVADESDAMVLETASTYLFYDKQRKKGQITDDAAALHREILARRSRLGNPGVDPFSGPEGPLISESSRPDLGHFPHRLGFAVGTTSRQPGLFEELSFKFALRDLLNNDDGYLPYSHIDFPWITLRWERMPPIGSRLLVENLTFLGITSLFPLTELEKKLSWQVLVEYYRPSDLPCDSCGQLRGLGGVGVTLELGTPNWIFYTLATVAAEAGSLLRFGPRLETATILTLFSRYKAQLGATLVTDLFQKKRPGAFALIGFNHAFSISRSFDVRLLSSFIAPAPIASAVSYEGQLNLNYYF